MFGRKKKEKAVSDSCKCMDVSDKAVAPHNEQACGTRSCSGKSSSSAKAVSNCGSRGTKSCTSQSGTKSATASKTKSCGTRAEK